MTRPLIYDVTKPYYRFQKYQGEVGIEIETESKNGYDVPEFSFWRATGDGSLRDFGVEYVLKQPVLVNKELPAALEEFKVKTEKLKFIKDSISTSVHVHLNMINESFLTLANFMTLYALMENLLIKFSGPDRLSNLFALPMCDAEQTVDNCVTFLTQVKKGGYRNLTFDLNRVKYAALNLSSFSRFGSLEIRSFRGETDIETIKIWVHLLYQLIEYSRREGVTPESIVVGWRDRGNDLVDEVFGDYAKHVSYGANEVQAMLKRNIWYAAKMSLVTKDWTTFGVPAQKKVTKAKMEAALERVAVQQFHRAYADLGEIERLVVNELVQRDAIGRVVFGHDDDRDDQEEALRPREAPIAPARRRAAVNVGNPFLEE